MLVPSLRPVCALYAIHLTYLAGTRLEPPSRFSEAKKRTFLGAFYTPMGAMETFNKHVRCGAWATNCEPEVRHLAEGHVLYFLRHDGAWAAPHAPVHDLTSY